MDSHDSSILTIFIPKFTSRRKVKIFWDIIILRRWISNIINFTRAPQRAWTWCSLFFLRGDMHDLHAHTYSVPQYKKFRERKIVEGERKKEQKVERERRVSELHKTSSFLLSSFLTLSVPFCSFLCLFLHLFLFSRGLKKQFPVNIIQIMTR